MKTLKAYLFDNSIATTNEQRLELGRLIASLNKQKGYKGKKYKMEDNVNVRVYDLIFLSSDEVSTIIINFLNK